MKVLPRTSVESKVGGAIVWRALPLASKGCTNRAAQCQNWHCRIHGCYRDKTFWVFPNTKCCQVIGESVHLYLMNIWQQSVLVLDLPRYLLNFMISLLPQPAAIMVFNDQKHSRWLLCSHPAPQPQHSMLSYPRDRSSLPLDLEPWLPFCIEVLLLASPGLQAVSPLFAIRFIWPWLSLGAVTWQYPNCQLLCLFPLLLPTSTRG